MGLSKSAQLETAPTKRGERKCLFIVTLQIGAVRNSAYRTWILELMGLSKSAQLETAPTKRGERKCLFIF